MGAVTRMQIAELQERDEGDPLWYAGLLADITNGDSNDLAFAKVCRDYDVSWGALRNWIKADGERERKYQDALVARRELRLEKAAANVARIAAVEHEDGKVGVGDTLKAAGLLLGDGGGKGGGLSIGVGGGTGSVRIAVEFVPAGRVVDAAEAEEI